MVNNIPKTASKLMVKVYRNILPVVDKELEYWHMRANQIPNNELRQQAIASIKEKRFHCQGGAVFSVLAGDRCMEAIQFIIAYQTISDYLDNLCDRSTSLDPNDFRQLHLSMYDALRDDDQYDDYYALRADKDDGNYLHDLVHVCKKTIHNLNGYEAVKSYLFHLEGLYADLQVHKHVKMEERLPRLISWFQKESDEQMSLEWYEYAAAAGSTLGVFCLISYCLGGMMTGELAAKVYQSYFPYIQGLHILLDYYIDQQEDKEENDLNFCNYYPNQQAMVARLKMFITKANHHHEELPHPQFHTMVCGGLVGLYMADTKVSKLMGGRKVAKTLMRASGWRARFFHWNVRMYYKFRPH